MEAALRLTPDLVVSDVSMPRMDGMELVRRLRAPWAEDGAQRTALIALTAHALEDERRRCLEAGFDDGLTKPMRRAALDAALRERLRVLPRGPAWPLPVPEPSPACPSWTDADGRAGTRVRTDPARLPLATAEPGRRPGPARCLHALFAEPGACA